MMLDEKMQDTLLSLSTAMLADARVHEAVVVRRPIWRDSGPEYIREVTISIQMASAPIGSRCLRRP